MKKSRQEKQRIVLVVLTIAAAIVELIIGRIPFYDTDSYVRAWGVISSGIVDLERTPVYPCIIGLAEALVGTDHMPFLIILCQQIIACVAVWYAYKIAVRITKSENAAFWIALVIALMPEMLSWRNCVVTESLAMSGSVFFVYCAIAIYDGKSRWNLLGFFFWLLFLVFLRPAQVCLLPVAIVAILVALFQKRSLLSRAVVCLLSVAVVTSFIFVYMGKIYQHYDIYSMTRVGIENEFYDMRQAGTLDPQKIANKDLANYIEKTYKENGVGLYDMKFSPILNKDIIYVAKHWDIKTLKQAVDTSRTAKNYLQGVVTRTFFAGKDIFIYPRRADVSSIFNFTLGWIYLLLVVYAVYLCAVWYRRKSVPWAQLLLFMLSASNMIVAILGAFGQGPGEWGRLIYPSKFIYIIMFGHLIFMLYRRIEQHTVKNASNLTNTDTRQI